MVRFFRKGLCTGLLSAGLVMMPMASSVAQDATVAEQGMDLNSLYLQAWQAYELDDYQKTIDLATELADAEDYRGHFLLGTLLFRGDGVPEDKQRGMAMLYASATKGYAHAQLAVAAIHHRGMLDGAPDLLSAMPWYRLAAEQGIPQAQTMVGIHYFRGVVLEKDMHKAREWLKQAAAQRYDAALMALAQINIDEAPERALSWMLVMRRINNQFLTDYAAENMVKVIPHVTADQVVAAQDRANQWLAIYVSDAAPDGVPSLETSGGAEIN